MYHINSNGLPKKCNKDPKDCKLGGPKEHFNTKEEAQRYANKVMSEHFSIIPDVKLLSADVLPDNILEILSYKHSELYSSAMYLNNKDHTPILCLGIDGDNNKVYQFFSFSDGVYYDITGIVANEVSSLIDYAIEKYNIKDSFKIVNYPDSLNMIEILLSINIDEYSAIVELEEYIKNKLKSVKEDEVEALEHILQELN